MQDFTLPALSLPPLVSNEADRRSRSPGLCPRHRHPRPCRIQLRVREPKVKVSKNMTADFPADFGARCAAWDNKRNGAYCMPGQDPGADKGWCAEPYCFVDPCNCDLDVPPTLANSYLPDASYQGKGLWYSYVTCGGKDYWMDAETKKQKQEAKGICEKKVEEKKWGKEKCRCVGYDGTPGTVNVTIDKKELKYPADTGATCESWDAKRHPDCVGDKPADWCKQEWCYVDPCECELDVPPKTSSYLPSGMVNGKPVYFSYATCGTSDSFSATNKESCVFQKSQDNCTVMTSPSMWQCRLKAAFPWSVASGTCLIDGLGCISSSGTEDGNDYPNGDSCQILVTPNNTLPINVIAFNTEANYDSLIVNGVSYSGSEGPVGIVPTEDISWESDGSVADAGWKICLGSDGRRPCSSRLSSEAPGLPLHFHSKPEAPGSRPTDSVRVNSCSGLGYKLQVRGPPFHLCSSSSLSSAASQWMRDKRVCSIRCRFLISLAKQICS
eukprot:s1652_g2.t2